MTNVVSIMMRYVVASLVAFSFVALVAVTLSAQQSFGRKGARGEMKSEVQQKSCPSQLVIVSGEGAAANDMETKKGKASGIGLEPHTVGQNLLVYLGPHIYVDLQNVRIVPGDKVEVKGVQTVLDGQIIYLAGEVRKGDEVLKLRDDKGAPLWTGTKQR